MFQFGVGFILGLLAGSLVDCIANRAEEDKSFWGRSYCLRCKKPLYWYDLFPVLSFILLKGRCHFCQQKIPLEVLVIEIVFGLIFGALFYLYLPDQFWKLSIDYSVLTLSNLFFKIFVLTILGILFLTDFKTGLIPDRITKPAIVITFFYLIFDFFYKVWLIYRSLVQSSLGEYLLPPYSDYLYRHALTTAQPLLWSVISSLILALFFGGLILITKGRGMGGGDLKLGIFIGLSLGFPNSILAILLSFFLGSIAGTVLILLKKKHFGQTIPFGPFLSLGAALSLLWGDQIISEIKSSLGIGILIVLNGHFFNYVELYFNILTTV